MTSRDYKAPPIIVIEGNGTRESHQGIGWKESEIMYTLNSTEVHAVFDARGNGGGCISPTITGDHQSRITDYTAIVLKGVSIDAESRNKILRILFETYGAQEVIEWGVAIMERLQQTEILQSGMYESSVPGETENRNELDGCSLTRPSVIAEWLLRDMREQQECGCSPQRRKPAEQCVEQSTTSVPELSYQDTSSGKALFDMWRKGKGLWLLREALSEIQEIRQSADFIRTGGDEMNGVSSVVRRLTPL